MCRYAFRPIVDGSSALFELAGRMWKVTFFGTERNLDGGAEFRRWSGLESSGFCFGGGGFFGGLLIDSAYAEFLGNPMILIDAKIGAQNASV